MTASGKIVRIGCGAGFWGDSPEGPAQLVRSGGIDYLVMDYLAEITMSILARMKAKQPDLGYATDFVTMVMKPLAREIAQRNIRVVTNAGGVNPDSCRDALLAALAETGVKLKVAVVHGDDLAARVERYRAAGTVEMFSAAPMPERLASVNAYLGAFPIAAALDAGADIVVAGRVVDSALALGPLIHEFGWRPTDYDLLSAGSLAGHVIECGAQATGGIFTDWRDVTGWDDMGFPIAECAADGSFVVTKPAGTGGLVTTSTVAEQIVYEVGDPTRYILPDVTADWSAVRLEQVGPDRVLVSGAHGMAPTGSYKVSGTYADGYRAGITMMIVGREAADKARATAAAILRRSGRLMHAAGFDGFSETSFEILGSEANYGTQSRAMAAREVILKIAVRHPSRDALAIFAREIFPAATAMAQGTTGIAGGRPEPQPVVRLFSFLVPKTDVTVNFEIHGKTHAVVSHLPNARIVAEEPAVAQTHVPNLHEAADGPRAAVPLIALAHGRSGDKGDIGNIGVLARRPEYLSWIRRSLTAEAVGDYFAHFARGRVERFDWPGLNGLNFLLLESLGGGGIASLRHDPQGKALAQILMDFPVEVPAAWLAKGGLLEAWSDEAV
ncbi:MAG: DUF1446 domain-containing protein [Rhizobiales bacterium]|nr:DUF1446 domain-containing protein [Hyphomicrobiales bacterium]OJU31357.1 MAG: terpene utilization protein AtuA [Rhizobiales bacterium 68-8]